MIVKYTDIDYYVFTDAARFLTQGKSPYKRATYRYTPLLAWSLTPNIYIGQLYGKCIFILCDILAGYLTYRILQLRCLGHSTALFCAQLWLFNPLPITVCSRGNAESIMAVLVLGTLYWLLKHGPYAILTPLLYGLSVHLKIYPVTYCLPLYLVLCSKSIGKGQGRISQCVQRWTQLDIWPNCSRLLFVLVAVFVFVGVTGFCYALYGDEFLQETYLHHITRRDTRHNFSPYFYMLYLTGESRLSLPLGLAAFLPQLLLLGAISIKYYEDLPMCSFLHTFVFVTFNKVCTSQYFLWYLTLLPLIIPQLEMKTTEVGKIIALWFVGQAIWLAPAYYLEFESINTFIYIWAAGLVFFIINIWVLYKVMTSHRHVPLFMQGHRVKVKDPMFSTCGDIMIRWWTKRTAKKVV